MDTRGINNVEGPSVPVPLQRRGTPPIIAAVRWPASAASIFINSSGGGDGRRTSVAAQAQDWRSAAGSGAAPAMATVRAYAAARVTTRGSVMLRWGRSRGNVGVATSKSSTWGRGNDVLLAGAGAGALALASLIAGSYQGEHVSGPQRFALRVPPPQGGWNMSPAPTPPLSELL